MEKRVLSTRGQLPGPGLDRLAAQVGLIRGPAEARPTAAALQALATGVSGILCLGNDLVDAALLDAAGSQLRIVSLASAGFDGVDRAAAAERGVVVTHTPGVLAETTADLVWSLILMARRRLGAARDQLHAGAWTTFHLHDHLGLDVHGTKLGLVGYGQIGRAVARRAAGFGVHVLCHDPYSAPDDGLAEPADLETLLAQSDIVSLHVPLTATTHNLIGATELRAMKPAATLVNTSRGGVVDEKALLAALRAGTIHSAGLDVFEQEPRGADVADLVAEARLVALPHVGSATEATRSAMVNLAVDNLLAVLAGKPAHTPLPGTTPATQ
ncbi:D-glycerate dehydrogenase [Amycolatopsis ultiminotia]|uniref:D-glycerate dehydrogenase n=1 Tax=Amycolatopsis ultiminotia TaxID=543629 RepID=A0ABP6XMF3_9PSEU